MLELLRDIWSRAQSELRLRAGEAAHAAWLADLRPLALERGICYLEAKSQLVCDRVQRMYVRMLEEGLSAEFGTRISVTLVTAPETLAPDQLDVSPQRPIVDDSNQQAAAMLSALCEGRPLPSNRFLFYGAPGTGKTFLLRWWAQQTKPAPALYLGPSLVRAFQACLRDGRLHEIHAELRADVPLLIDEIHRISGHRRIQRELLAVLDSRDRAAAPVLMASRWHPREIWDLDPSLAAFLVSGMVTKIESPGPQARLFYLRALEGARARNGRAVEIESIARDVRGGYDDVRRAWVLQRERHRLGPRELQLIDPRAVFNRTRDRVAARLAIDVEALVGKGQGRQVSFARQLLSYLCVQQGLSRAEVGRYLGGRSRAAVSYATKTLQERIASEPEVQAMVEEMK